MAMPIGFGGSNKTVCIPKFVVAFLLLLLVFEKPTPSLARLRKLSSVTPRRGFSESKPPGATKKSSLAFELMAPHHLNSPYSKPNVTLSQRMVNAAKSSRTRARFLASKMGRSQVKFEAEAVYSTPLYSGNEGGYDNYIMQVTLGTPARTFVVVADTGSDLAWVQCSCSTCLTEPDAPFDPTASSTYSFLSCTNDICVNFPDTSCSSNQACFYKYGYGDESETNGDLSLETITLTTTTASEETFSDFVFGCGTDNSGLFKGVDGLFGLGRGQQSLVSQLGSHFNNVFSYCLVDFISATSVTSSLLFGSAGDSSLKFSYTPLISSPPNPTYYYVNLVGITVNDQQLDYPADTFSVDASTGSGGMILDSGTTITQLAAAAYNSLQTALASLIDYPTVDESSNNFDLCYNVSNVDSPSYPTVVFQFEGLNLTLPDDNLFAPFNGFDSSSEDGIVCLAMQSTSLSVSIFGNIQQQNFQMAYDNAKGQVGFASTTCKS